MRTTARILLMLSLAAAAFAADERVAPRPRNVLTGYLDQAQVHPGIEAGALTIFPVSLRRVERLERLLTAEEALRKNLLAIEELEKPDVNRARFINRSERDMIFLMAGEIITGGRQNRILASDALLAPDSAVVLPVYCVQKGRWSGETGFDKTVTVAPQGVRERSAQSAGQKEVWTAVSGANARMKAANASDDLTQALNKDENARGIRALTQRVLDKLPEDCAGVVVACGDEIVGADLFHSPELFAGMRRRVLDSYVSEFALGQERKESARAPDQKSVREYLQGCYRSRFTADDMQGVGQIYRLSGQRTGRTLAYEPGRGKLQPTGAQATDYMVHTALMRELEPVKPVPRPVEPLPRRE